jgi:hypothetical protein
MSNIPLKTRTVGFKLTAEQYRDLEQRAAHSGLRLGTWMRSILLQAASQKSRKGYLRIREPDGATT